MREIILDIETTGLSYKSGDRIIEVACVELVNHIKTGSFLQFYCSTNKTIAKEVEKIHGLTNNFLNQHPTFVEQSKKFLQYIKDDTLVIHNAEFDTGFINNELNLAGLKTLKNKAVDTVLLARRKLNIRTVNLDSLCKKFDISTEKRKTHGALLDCQLLSEVYLELLGGRQTSFELAKKEKNQTPHVNKKDTNKQRLHTINLSKEEIEQHKDFVSNNLKNPMWNKIEY